MRSDETLLRRARREPLFGELPRPLSWGRAELERCLPHRAPMLLLDRIVAADEDGRRALGERTIDPADPVLRGHFPGDPVYPGALLLEMGGQLGLCLGEDLARGVPPARPRPVRLLRVHGAEFVAPARPGERLEVRAEVVEDDGWTLRIAAQVSRDARIVCAAVLEAMWVEET